MPDHTLKISLSHLIKWPMRTVLNLMRAQTRFVLLSPNFCKTQLIYDRFAKTFLTIKIRDTVDYHVVQQVFGAEDYCLRRLHRRYPDVIAKYREICANDKVPLILDLGAHCGLASKYFSHEFPEAKIIAVEPDAENVAAARMNLRNETNVAVVFGAISSRSGKGRLLASKWGSWNHRTEHDEAGNLEFLSVNAILADKEISRCSPFIVKIDIEGFENDLFMANTEWVERFPLLIVELHDWMLPREGKSRNFLKCIAGLDRDFVHINENVFSISNTVTGSD